MDKKKIKPGKAPRESAGNPAPFFLIAAAFAAAFTGQSLMYNNPANLGKGMFFFAAAFALVIAARLVSGSGAGEEPRKPATKAELAAFAVIMAAGIAFRAADINVMPPGFFWDEGMYGQHAIKIMNGEEIEGDRLPVYIKEEDNAAAYIYMISAVFKFFGTGTVQQRMTSVIIGILTVAAVYFMTRAMFGPGPAAVAGLLFAVMRWHLTFSRWGMHAIFAVFAGALALYLAWRVYRHRKWTDFALLGLVTAMTPNTYSAGRLIPVGLAFFVLYVLIKEKGFFAQNWKKMVLGTVVMLVFFSPMLMYIKKHPDRYFARARQIFIFDKHVFDKEAHGAKRAMDIVSRKAKETLLIFNCRGVYDPKHNLPGYPMLDRVTGAFFALGTMAALSSPLAPASVLLLSSLAVFLLPGMLTDLMAQGIRMITVIPVIAGLIALFLHRLFLYYRLAGFRGSAPKLVMAAVLGASALAAASANFDEYFVKQERTSQGGYTDTEYWIGKQLKEMGPGWEGILLTQSAYNYTVNFMLYPQKNYTKFNPATHIPIRAEEGVNYVYMLTPDYYEIAPLLRELYPGGVYAEKRGKYSKDLYYFSLAVPYEEIARADAAGARDHGLTGTYYTNSMFAGEPRLVRREPFLLFWGLDNPVSFPFSMEWTGRIRIDEPGEYVFAVRTNGNTDLAIGGKTVSRTSFDYAREETYDAGKVRLARGFHTIRARYWENVRHLRYKLSWTKPGAENEALVPLDVLYPDHARENKHAARVPVPDGRAPAR